MQTSTDNFTVVSEYAVIMIKLMVAFIIAQWLATPSAIRLLVILMAVDIVTGLIAAYISKTLSSSNSFQGMIRKVLALILITVAELIGAGTASIGLDLGIHVGRVCTIFYTINEMISIIENCSRAGLPIPINLMATLTKVKDSPMFYQKVMEKNQADRKN